VTLHRVVERGPKETFPAVCVRGARRRGPRGQRAFPHDPVRFPREPYLGKRTFSPELSLVQGFGKVRFRTPWQALHDTGNELRRGTMPFWQSVGPWEHAGPSASRA